MHPLLKYAYQQGIEQSRVKEASGWSRAAAFMNPFKNVAKSVVETAGPVAGQSLGKWGRGLSTTLGQQASMKGLGRRALAQHGLRTGLGAGVGAVAGGEGERGRGAMIGALTGLGFGAGARLGGAGARKKMLAGIGGKASRLVQQGKLAPNTTSVQQFVRQQATKGTWKHLNARQLMGSAALGTGAAVGTGVAANRLIPRAPEPQNPYAQLFRQVGGFGAARPRYYQPSYAPQQR